MSVPVEPQLARPSLPLWIMAAAISAVAIRYTFFPPCCGEGTVAAPQIVAMRSVCDSVVPIPDGCDTFTGDTYVLSSTGLLQRTGKNAGTIVIPEGGVLFRPMKPVSAR